MSTDPVFSEVQKINPSAIIELFTLQLDNSLHGATTIYRFHSGSNLNANGEIVWAGNSYQRFPIEATGFAYQRGQIPRPKLVVSNALGTISAILLLVNQTTAGNTVKKVKILTRPSPPADKQKDNLNFLDVFSMYFLVLLLQLASKTL